MIARREKQPARPATPLHARGNRILGALDREVAVATRADPALRGAAEATAAEIVRRWNAYDPARDATSEQEP